MTQAGGELQAGGPIVAGVDRRAPAHRARFAGEFFVAVVGVLVAQAVADQAVLASDAMTGQHSVAAGQPLLEVVVRRDHRVAGPARLRFGLLQQRALGFGLDRDCTGTAALGAGHHPQGVRRQHIARWAEQGGFLHPQTEGVLQAQDARHVGVVLGDLGDLIQRVHALGRPGVIVTGSVAPLKPFWIVQVGGTRAQHTGFTDPAAQDPEVGKALLQGRGG